MFGWNTCVLVYSAGVERLTHSQTDDVSVLCCFSSRFASHQRCCARRKLHNGLRLVGSSTPTQRHHQGTPLHLTKLFLPKFQDVNWMLHLWCRVTRCTTRAWRHCRSICGRCTRLKEARRLRPSVTSFQTTPTEWRCRRRTWSEIVLSRTRWRCSLDREVRWVYCSSNPHPTKVAPPLPSGATVAPTQLSTFTYTVMSVLWVFASPSSI